MNYPNPIHLLEKNPHPIFDSEDILSYDLCHVHNLKCKECKTETMWLIKWNTHSFRLSKARIYETIHCLKCGKSKRNKGPLDIALDDSFIKFFSKYTDKAIIENMPQRNDIDPIEQLEL